MRRDFSQPILDLNDKPVKMQTGVDGAVTEMTLGMIAMNALLGTYEDERNLTGKEKAERMQIALRINKRMKEVDLTAEQMTMVKTLIAKCYGPLFVGRAWELLELEPKAVDKTAEA